MASFDDREKGYENKYAHDQELEFKARVRRDRLLGDWVSSQLGLTGAAAEAYGQALSRDAHEKKHEDKLVAKVIADLSAKGVKITEHLVRKKIVELYDVAREQVARDVKR